MVTPSDPLEKSIVASTGRIARFTTRVRRRAGESGNAGREPARPGRRAGRRAPRPVSASVHRLYFGADERVGIQRLGGFEGYFLGLHPHAVAALDHGGAAVVDHLQRDDVAAVTDADAHDAFLLVVDDLLGVFLEEIVLVGLRIHPRPVLEYRL